MSLVIRSVGLRTGKAFARPIGQPVTFIGHTTANPGSSTSVTFNLHANAQPGDLVIAVVAPNSPRDITSLDGFTLIHTALNPNFDRPTYIAYKWVPDPKPNSFTWTFDGTNTNRSAVALVFRHPNPSNPILDDGWNQGSATPPSLTAVAGAAAVGAWRRVTVAGTLDAPSEMVELTNALGGTNVALTVAYEVGLSAGAYTRTADATTTNLNASMVLIRP